MYSIYNNLLLSYARKGAIGPLRRSAFRKYCRRNNGRRSIANCEHGFQMHTVLGDSVDNQILVYGVFEPGTSMLLSVLSPDSDVFVDIGCNVGYFSCLYGANNLNKLVLAVDPNPKMLESTRENMELNNSKNFELINYGVGEKYAIAELNIPRFRHSLSSFAYQPATGGPVYTLESRIVPLSEVVKPYSVKRGFLKIDTEGFEYAVLRGMSDDCIEQIQYILFELSPQNLVKAGVKSKDIFSLPLFEKFDIYTVHEHTEASLCATTSKKMCNATEFNGNLFMVKKHDKQFFYEKLGHSVV